MDDIYKALLDNYPFLSLISYGGHEYIGIIQNHDELITTIYDFALLKTKEQKTLFLSYGDQWWWESSRTVPIHLYLRQEWTMFKPTLKTFNSKDVLVQHGPAVSLKELGKDKSKRRSIVLVKKIP